MAELTVKIPYVSPARTALLAALRLTFPLWGVLAPAGAAISLIMVINALNGGGWDNNSAGNWKTLALLFGDLVIFTTALMLTRSLSHDCITADKDGLIMPWMFSRRSLAWSSVKRASVLPAVSSEVKRQRLVLLGDNGSTLKLKLSRLKQQEIEQLMLALEMWAVNCQKDASIHSLQENIKQIAPQSTEVSYTNMWEDELRRRFCAAAFMPLEPGVHVRQGTLKVLRQLAIGGLSALYLCQLEEKKLVVIKEAVIPEDSPESARTKAQEMFEREAKLLMKLDHPSIVKVLDCFVDNGRNYMMLEYINGQDIRQFIKQNGPQHEHVVVEWAVQIAGILKYLHEQDPPVIHRDLTPDNLVIREDGSIVLIDFGAANEFIGNSTGTFVGKQSFIAPEQFRGKAIPQSDIYAFGCTVYFMLTGKEPEALSTSAPRDVSQRVSQELNEFVECCTQMEARDRYQSAAQLLPVLKRMAASMMVS